MITSVTIIACWMLCFVMGLWMVMLLIEIMLKAPILGFEAATNKARWNRFLLFAGIFVVSLVVGLVLIGIANPLNL